MIPPIPQIVPMGLWEDFIGALNTMMQPLYWAVSWVMTSFHTLYASLLGAGNGWSWALAIISLTTMPVRRRRARRRNGRSVTPDIGAR